MKITLCRGPFFPNSATYIWRTKQQNYLTATIGNEKAKSLTHSTKQSKRHPECDYYHTLPLKTTTLTYSQEHNHLNILDIFHFCFFFLVTQHVFLSGLLEIR